MNKTILAAYSNEKEVLSDSRRENWPCEKVNSNCITECSM